MNNLLKRDFTQIPNQLINDPKLSRDARFLFVYLCSKPNDWKYHNSVIQKDMGCSKDTRIKYMKELVSAGWIVVTQKQGQGGKFGGNDITLNPYPNFTDTVKKPQPKSSAAEEKGGGKSTTLNNTDNKQILNSEKKVFEPAEKSAEPHKAKPQEPNDLFGKAPNPKKKTLFKNSLVFDFEIFEKKLTEEKNLGVDINYYYNAIKDWNDIKKVTRDADGWVATARTFMRGDKNKGRLQVIKTDQQQAVLDKEMQEYLGM